MLAPVGRQVQANVEPNKIKTEFEDPLEPDSS